jgi:hypothetical protein
MNMKKTIAAVAASALAISAVAVPANAANDPANYAVGGNLTYSLQKIFWEQIDGTATVTNRVSFPTTWNGTDNFVIINLSDSKIDLTKPVNIVFANTDGTNGRYSYSFILEGNDKNFVPSDNISYTQGSTANFYYEPVAANQNIKFLKFNVATLTALTGQATATVSGTYKHPFTNNSQELSGYLTATTGSYDPAVPSVAFDVMTGAVGLIPTSAETFNALSVTQGVKDVTNFTKSTNKKLVKPYKSFVNSITTGPSDIVTYLSGYLDKPSTIATTNSNEYGFDGVNRSANRYQNFVPVINDIISNYNDITFTFNTATENVVIATTTDTGNNGAPAKYADFYQTGTGIDDWGFQGKGDMYKNAFGQQLYNWYGDDLSAGTSYVPFDSGVYFGNGIAYNLFSGALIINGSLSMQLADTDVFSYGASGLTFNYQDLQSKAYGSYNSYLQLIHSMVLATSVDWYWDSLTISYANTADDTADTGAGTTSEDEVLPDDTDDADLDADLDALDAIDEPEVPAEPVEEPAVVVDEPAAAEPAAPAANPATGNAPIALAVIPVALAAAAIIAKKRK